MNTPSIPSSPRILTTTVGSYPVPDWLSALPSEQAVIDATRVIFDTQRQSGIDLPTDGEIPATCNLVVGLVIPIPTLPVLSMRIRSVAEFEPPESV